MNIQFASLIENAPNLSGVYKMYSKDDLLLYIGKAKNLNLRLKQYLDISKLEPHKQVMRSLISYIEWIITDTEEEALILEEKLIKEEKPKYNIMMTDNKMYPMLCITDSMFPRLLKIRGKISNNKNVFGPYPSVNHLNETIKILQKICKIRTCSDSFMKNRTRPCLLYQIKRCSAPCINNKQIEEYKNNVNLAKKILSGDTHTIINDLSKIMKKYSDNLEFEKACEIRNQIKSLTKTTNSFIHKRTFDFKTSFDDMKKLINLDFKTACVFDNSHLFGTNPVGSMIAFSENGFEQKLYKHFKLKDLTKSGNDIGMMEEFITRAFREKNNFDLVIIDGGIQQWNIAKKILPDKNIIAITKGDFRDGDEHIILNDKNIIKPDPNSKPALLIRLVRNESHRFAISFHRKIRDKNFIQTKLDEIEGIGKAKKRILMNYFGSVPEIIKADINDLLKVPKLGKSSAYKIYNYFHK